MYVHFLYTYVRSLNLSYKFLKTILISVAQGLQIFISKMFFFIYNNLLAVFYLNTFDNFFHFVGLNDQLDIKSLSI